MTIPSGPLRESLSAIKKAQIIIINGNKNKLFENRILDISNKIKIFYSKYIPTNVKEFKNKKLFAFAGIGNPNNFFKLLTENKLNLKKKVSFPDHYQFIKIDIQKIIAESKKKKLDIITTEKDYFRIKDYGFKNIKFLKIKLEILEKDKLINQILNYI
jgi:tetraacyldisaccharide 4'-kinase